jgi:hypothetical protein
MSEKDKHTLTGWLIGVATTVALALAGWTLLKETATSEHLAVVTAKQDANFKEHDGLKDSLKELKADNDKCHDEIKHDVTEIKADIKALLRRQ